MNLLNAISSYSDYLINERNYSRNTLVNYVRDLQDLRDFISNDLGFKSNKIELEYVDEKTLKQFIASYVLHEDIKYSKRTISRKISTLKSFFKFLNKKKYLNANQARNLIFP